MRNSQKSAKCVRVPFRNFSKVEVFGRVIFKQNIDALSNLRESCNKEFMEKTDSVAFKIGQDKIRSNGEGIEITIFGWGVLYSDTKNHRELHFDCSHVFATNSVFLKTYKSTWEDGSELSETDRTRVKNDLQKAFSECRRVHVEFK